LFARSTAYILLAARAVGKRMDDAGRGINGTGQRTQSKEPSAEGTGQRGLPSCSLCRALAFASGPQSVFRPVSALTPADVRPDPGRVLRGGDGHRQLRAWIERYNLKTIIILRGRDARQAAEEDAVARSMGADVVVLKLSAYVSMPSDKLVQLIEILEGAKQPMLLHCRHGVDRAGTASAIAAWLVGGRTYGYAKWQAYMPPGPWKNRKGKGHISDVLAFYERYCREEGLCPDDPSLFKYWARNVYQSGQAPEIASDDATE
jgi:hypothetical protein